MIDQKYSDMLDMFAAIIVEKNETICKQRAEITRLRNKIEAAEAFIQKQINDAKEQCHE